MPKKRLASARTEAAEALWFEKNQDQLLKLFEEAGRKGMLRIPADDLDRARHLAERKGLPYQTYMKLLLREGLDREEKTRRRA